MADETTQNEYEVLNSTMGGIEQNLDTVDIAPSVYTRKEISQYSPRIDRLIKQPIYTNSGLTSLSLMSVNRARKDIEEQIQRENKPIEYSQAAAIIAETVYEVANPVCNLSIPSISATDILTASDTRDHDGKKEMIRSEAFCLYDIKGNKGFLKTVEIDNKALGKLAEAIKSGTREKLIEAKYHVRQVVAFTMISFAQKHLKMPLSEGETAIKLAEDYARFRQNYESFPEQIPLNKP